jgi:putative cell wall-binding protein
MKQGLSRFRRFAISCIVAVTAASGLSVLGLAGTAGAAAGPGSTITAATAPAIGATGTNQPAGNEVITLAPGTTFAPGATITVTVLDNASGATITFDHNPSLTVATGAGDVGICSGGNSGCTITGAGTNTETITLTTVVGQATATPSASTITLSNIGYSTTASAGGFVLVSTGGATLAVAASPASANATVNSSALAALTAVPPSPLISPGTTSPAGNWNLALSGIGNQWVTGDKYFITVARNDTTNCETVAKPDTLAFSGTPVGTGSAITGGATAVPTVTATLAAAAGSSCGVTNELILTFTNSGTITSGAAAPVNVSISGVKYAVSSDTYTTSVPGVGSKTNLGPITVASGYNAPPTFATSGNTTPPSVPHDVLVGASGAASNAAIGVNTLIVTANKPSTTININATSTGGEVVNQPISPITIAEGLPGALKGGVVGWACLSLTPGAPPGAATEFASTPTVTATGGGIAVGNVSLLTPGGFTGPSELVFQVTTASSGTPGTVTVSGIKVNVPGFIFLQTAEVASGGTSAADACTVANGGAGTATQYVNPVTGLTNFQIVNEAARIFGQDQDATAAQAFELAPFGGPVCHAGLTPSTPAVLVTNGSYQDALSASYLAGQLHTGILTTDTNTVSPEALQALALTGVTEVFVVGGPLVVSPADITQLQNTPSYRCGTGGVTPRINNGQVVNLIVQQIFGQTADDTASAVATFPGAGIPGTANFQGAYAGTFNDTSGSSGSGTATAPDVPVTTAILATDQSFTDAASASVVAYAGSRNGGNGHGFPLLLTGPSTLSAGAAEGLTNDSVQQVIVMGGPIAISDNVLSQVEAMGISVIRVAGQDFTDTSQQLGQFDLASVNSGGQANGLDYDTPDLVIARGDYYTDAIVASQIATTGAGAPSPILLTWDPNNTSRPGGTDYLGKFLTMVGQGIPDPGTPTDGTINNLIVFGGMFAISSALEGTIGHDLNG